MKHCLRLIPRLVLLLLAGLPISAEAQKKFSITKTPAWVAEVPFNEKAMPADVEDAGGSYLLLIDKQYQVQQEEQYRRYATKILNEKGLQEEADISISYDPAYQQLNFHSIEVLREGKTLNKLVAADFKIIQREAGAAERIYDGSLTAVIHLKDVRVGDVLTYSFSIKGRNPMYQGLFFEDLYWQYSVPVARLHYRLLLPEGRTLRLREKGEVTAPDITTEGGQRIYRWQKETVPAITYESQTPAWYDVTPLTQLSEFKDWGQVVELFQADYQAAQAIPDARWAALSKELFKPYDSEDLKITRLLHFVQNDIRYLGLESGISAYKPHAPAQVLQQKWGDCKDKALLLCALLHKLGIEAYPALVNTYQRGSVAEQLPNPGAFNHCIVRMEHQDSTYWFDATTNSQGGTYKTASLPHYTKALLMKKGERDLSTIPDYPLDRRQVKEYYVIKKDTSSELTIMSRYKGFEAEAQRSYFRNNSLREIEKNYLNYYAGLYPGISLREGLQFRDRDTEVETEENYSIQNLWESSSDKEGYKVASFYPLYLNDYLVVPDKKLRDAPFMLNYPLQISEELILEMPEHWPVTEESSTVSNDFFTFTYKSSYRHPVITVRYTFDLHKNHVPANQVAAYIKDIDKVKNHLGYELFYAGEGLTENRLSYPLVVLALLMTGLFVVAGMLVYRKYDPRPLSPVRGYDSIGGWLFLPLIGLMFSPVRVLYHSISWDYFNAAVLHRLFDASSPLFNPLHGAILVGELLFNLAVGVMAVVLLVLMFRQRSSFPKLMILYLAGNFGFLLLELIVLEGASLVDRSQLGEAYTELGKSFISCLIWIPYFSVSDRVKETFTVQRRPEQLSDPHEDTLEKEDHIQEPMHE